MNGTIVQANEAGINIKNSTRIWCRLTIFFIIINDRRKLEARKKYWIYKIKFKKKILIIIS